MIDYINRLSLLSKQYPSIELFDLFDSKMLFSDTKNNRNYKTQVYDDKRALKKAFCAISKCFEHDKVKLKIDVVESVCHIKFNGNGKFISDSCHGQFAVEIFRSTSIPIEWSTGQVIIKMKSSENFCA